MTVFNDSPITAIFFSGCQRNVVRVPSRRTVYLWDVNWLFKACREAAELRGGSRHLWRCWRLKHCLGLIRVQNTSHWRGKRLERFFDIEMARSIFWISDLVRFTKDILIADIFLLETHSKWTRTLEVFTLSDWCWFCHSQDGYSYIYIDNN